jgi:diguanylate cyclase (GGDEF)-like protein
VLVLTGSVRPEQVAQVFAVGADDYVAKPVLGPELLTRITNRLERVRLLRRMAETDPLTGVANRTAFESAFARLAERGDREGQPVSLALLDVDAFRRLNEEHGHDLGDAVLQRVASVLSESFRGDDVVARWGGKEFVVGMLGLREEEGVGRLAAALETVREQSFPAGSATGPVRVSFSAAVAERRPRRSTTRELYRELAVTIDAARAVGGNRVVPAGWRPDADPSHVDVLLVEDDDALAEVLAHTLQTRGLRGAHLADGLLALERLTGPDPMTARVILLDVDLPGLNGLDLLARLAGAGVLARTRVIMLTARSGEGDVLAALRAGAFDHIAKPFSIPVLMQRVRRAIMEGR